MFKSATIRLTGWYLLILMTISVVFSFVVYGISFNEVENRLNRFQDNMQQIRNFNPEPILTERLRVDELNKAKSNLAIELLYSNIFILIGGGLISYLLAKKSIDPIERAHEEQSRFTSDASHELRTPLAVIKTEIEVALRGRSASTEDLREVLASNLEEIEKLSKLSDMLLSLSQIEKSELETSSIDLVKITRSTIKSFKKSSTLINIDTDKKSIFITGNETAISDVIRILIDNAMIYGKENSEININLSTQDKFAKFEITNFGEGIQPDKMPYIFDRFYRADSSRTNGNKKGYGLGLALAKKIIDLHSGNIFAVSIPNKETTFTFLIDLDEKF